MSFRGFELTGGVCSWLYYNDINEVEWPPAHIPRLCRIQLLSVKKVAEPPKFRITISDGVNIIQGMLRDTLNHWVASGQICKGAVVSVSCVSSDFLRGKRLVIIHAIDSVLTSGAERIGDPALLPPPSSVASGIARDAAMAGSNIPPELNPARIQPPKSQAGPSKNTQSEPRNPAQIPVIGSQPGTSSERITVSIASLNSYSVNWTIKAKVVSKSPILTTKNSNPYFFVHLADHRDLNAGHDQTRIKAMVFDRVDELRESMREGQVYYVSGAKLTRAREQYRRQEQNMHDFELTLNRDTRLELFADAPPPAPLSYNFLPIASVSQLSTDSTCDILGVLYKCDPVKEQESTKGKFKLRDITIVDMSRTSIRVTLFRTAAENFKVAEEEIIAFKGLVVKDFQGVCLQMTSSSSMMIHPDLKETFDLRGWYDSVGHSQNFHPCGSASTYGSGMGSAVNSPQKHKQSPNDISEPARPLTVREVLDEKYLSLPGSQSQSAGRYGSGKKGVKFSLQAAVVWIDPTRVTYPACSSCMKKAQRGTDGRWNCPKGHKAAEPNYRYLMHPKVADYSGEIELQAFDPAGQVLLGTTAKDLEHLRQTPGLLHQFQAVLQAGCSREFTFECHVDQYQGRTQYVIDRVVPLDYADEADQLLNLLHSHWAISNHDPSLYDYNA
ncbi:Replication factor A protein 1 [Pleurotus pulmonarius]|nr:Replication factor A protein 1 [Pleurotus pulmonarius]